jgi:hypothetical protein
MEPGQKWPGFFFALRPDRFRFFRVGTEANAYPRPVLWPGPQKPAGRAFLCFQVAVFAEGA